MKIASLMQRVFGWPFRGRQLRAMASRYSYSRDDFRKYFAATGAASNVIDAVWETLIDHAVIEFKPMPEDNLQYIFGLADEDLDIDVVLQLLKNCGCRIPKPDEIEKMGSIDTVEDLVRFVSTFA